MVAQIAVKRLDSQARPRATTHIPDAALDAVERAELNQPFIEPLCGRLLNAPVEKGAKTLLKLEIDQKLLRRRAEPLACLFGPKALGQRFQLIRSRVPWRIERLQGVAVQQNQKSRLQVGDLILAVVRFQGWRYGVHRRFLC